MANFDNLIDKILKNEGGYVNDPKDSGAETNFGISKTSYPHLDIKNITVSQAKDIYKKDYWDKIKGDQIVSQDIAFEIFDFAVNAGVKTASKLVQIVLDVTVDGIIGKNTLSKLEDIDDELFIAKYKLAKVSRYTYLAQKYPKNRKFLLGWIKRAIG
jgi:lysozyme family protein